MKKYFLYLTLLSIIACKKDATTSDCLKSKITAFQANAYDGAKIEQYSFDNKNVYAFDDGTSIADGVTFIIETSNCDTLCMLGGIAGFTKCPDKDFYKNATFVKEIWKK